MAKVSVVFYSMYGHVYRMAEAVAEVALPVRQCPAAPTENEARDDEERAEDDRR